MTGLTNTTPPVVAPGELLAVALEAAQAGAAVVRDAAPRVRSIAWQTKRPADFVSEVDLAAEAAVLGVVRQLAPHAAILAEESGSHDGLAGQGNDGTAASAGLAPAGLAPAGLAPAAALGARPAVMFVVDPLDGTTNFLHGYPEYAVSVGVLVDGVPVAGVIIDVALGETFTAATGSGAFVNGSRIQVSPIDDPGRALIGTGFPFTRMEDIDPYTLQLARIMRGAAGVRRAGAAALDLAAVAAGRFEAFWETVLSPWDIAAGLVLVREAGGVVTDLTGAPCQVARTGIVAGNPAVHAWLLGEIAKGNDGPADYG
ncbi:MAG: inositol monophosphatase [Gemmatimonadetes bacterium]|nr:inositol monophosphatase [Gemmatimonadota bacterium]